MSALEMLRESNPTLAFEVGLRGEVSRYQLKERIVQNGSEVTFVAGVDHYYPELTGETIILEHSIPAIRGFLEAPEGKLALEQGAKIVFTGNEMAYRELGWQHLFQSYQVLGDDRLICEFMDGAAMCASEYADFGAKVFKNLWHNFTGVIEHGGAFQGAFKGIPAIVCGAGPSLADDFEHLRALSDRALIFGGGSSLAPLAQNGVPVHFGGAIDPDPPGARFRAQSYFELPMLYQMRTSNELMNDVHGRKIWCGTPDGAELEGEILQKAGATPFTIDGGWVVSNFLVAVAHHMGCDPIITVGMDGCWKRDQEYVAGVSESGPPVGEIEVVDRDGNVAFTRKDLLWSTEWFAQFARSHPKGQFINATRGGLPIPEWEERTLDAIEFGAQYDFAGFVQSVDTESLSGDGQSHFWKGEFDRMKTLLDQLQKALHETGGEIEGEALLLDFEVRQEVLYKCLLNPLWAMFRGLLLKEGGIASLSQVIFFLQVIEKYAEVDYSCGVRGVYE